MFWIIFTVFFAVLFSIFFLIPDSSNKNNQQNNMQTKLNEQSKKQQLSSIKKSMNSEYSTYSSTLKEMSSQKLNEVNSSKKKKVTIHLNGLIKSAIEIGMFISQIKSKQDEYTIIFLYSTEKSDVVTDELIKQLKDEFKQSSFIHSKTCEGMQSVLRQLNPRLHIEQQISLLSTMKQHLNKIIYITSDAQWETLGNQYNQKNNIFFKEDITAAISQIPILLASN